jgi:probable F420-dependent oxidoreductase
LHIGVVYPQTEYGSDPAAIIDYAQTAESLGYTHILAYDHVLGANPQRPGGWKGPYTHLTPFHEVFGLFSFMAAVTRRIGFATGILILPQRQTALAAKQAATLDVLSGGRLRLGVGLGWNFVEYTALGEDFHNRGRRSDEQIELLRLLWTQPLVTFKGRHHEIPDAGLNPLPVQQPIPIWFGGRDERMLRRMARLGDGWMLPAFHHPGDARPFLETLSAYLEEYGRDPSAFGLEPRINYGDGNPDNLQRQVREWAELGATHLSFNSMGAGLDTPHKHLAAIRAFAEILTT